MSNTKEVVHVKCHKCKCFRLPSEFLNSKKRKLKTCIKCRNLGTRINNRYLERKKEKNQELKINTDIIEDDNNDNEIIHPDYGGIDVESKSDLLDKCVEIVKKDMDREIELLKQLLKFKQQMRDNL